MNSNWRDSALCKGMVTNDFYPEMGVKGAIKQVREMKAFCRKCSVITECLNEALSNDEPFGIWGGLTPKERRKIKQESRKTKAIGTIVTVVKKNDSHEV